MSWGGGRERQIYTTANDDRAMEKNDGLKGGKRGKDKSRA